jgi:hypothetical protein
MPIWKLEPKHLDSLHWHASTYRGEVVVRATTEDAARNMATRAFGTGAVGQLGDPTLRNPWNQGELVTCIRMEDSGYDENGPDELLLPRHYA